MTFFLVYNNVVNYLTIFQATNGIPRDPLLLVSQANFWMKSQVNNTEQSAGKSNHEFFFTYSLSLFSIIAASKLRSSLGSPQIPQ